MVIELRKIKKDRFDELRKSITEAFETTGELSFSDDAIKTASEAIIVDGKPVELDVDIDKYFSIATTL